MLKVNIKESDIPALNVNTVQLTQLLSRNMLKVNMKDSDIPALNVNIANSERRSEKHLKNKHK